MPKMFDSRIDAAHQLAAALVRYRGQRPLVLAIPRGAVIMGRVLADELEGELDVILVRKLRSPFNPELAVGAIDESGGVHVAPHAIQAGADDAYLAREKTAQREVLRERRSLYTPVQEPVDPAGRTVIVVDDGLATGATMIAALDAARAGKPARLICAVPVGAPESLVLVAPHADEVVCLDAPTAFYAVGQFYRDFPQVEDDEVISLLRRRAGT